MFKSIIPALVVAGLAQTASAGLPGGLPPMPQDTFICEGQIGDSFVSLRGTLGIVEDDGLPQTQDHVASLLGSATLNISHGELNEFGITSFFSQFQVSGAQKSGVPTFMTGQGYLLRQFDGSPLAPSVESLRIEDSQQIVLVEKDGVITHDVIEKRAATLRFAGQDHVTTVECQTILCDLKQ